MKTILTIEGIVHGMNGKHGLIREHFHAAKKKKEQYKALFLSQTQNRHKGRVKITFIGYKAYLMDWDNFAASFKHLGDALVQAGIIKDDNPKVIVEFCPLQIKCKRVEQKVEIIIEDYDS